jgi:hypothetical protein
VETSLDLVPGRVLSHHGRHPSSQVSAHNIHHHRVTLYRFPPFRLRVLCQTRRRSSSRARQRPKVRTNAPTRGPVAKQQTTRSITSPPPSNQPPHHLPTASIPFPPFITAHRLCERGIRPGLGTPASREPLFFYLKVSPGSTTGRLVSRHDHDTTRNVETIRFNRHVRARA